MSKQIGIGKATRLARVGEMVSVSINGSTITAKVAQNLSSTKVLILFDGRTYHAYPHSKTSVNAQHITVLAKHEKRKPAKRYNDSAVIVYKVRYSNGTTTDCTLPYWRYYEGAGCIRVCGIGPYFSLAQCNNANRDNPFNDTYSIGYFKRGFLSVLGAPITDLGFFYPISTNPDYVYCRGDFIDSSGGTGQTTNKVVKGDGTFTERQWVLPQPDYGSLGYENLYINSYGHKTYDDSRITTGLLQQWNSLYNLEFYSYQEANSQTPGRTAYRPLWKYDALSDELFNRYARTALPWEALLWRLHPDGTYIRRDPNNQYSPQLGTWVGAPNWMWRRLDIHGILIYNTYYHNQADVALEFYTAVAQATAWKRQATRDSSFVLEVRSPSTIRLPPAQIISRTYSGEEDPPIPPGSGWELLWDTKTCPPSSSPQLEFDRDFYYVTVNGQNPKLLGIFRADDNVDVLLTNLGNGRYRGALRCGTKIVNEVRYFAETKIFNSENDSVETYTYPATIPSVQEDWQNFRYIDWKINPDIPEDIEICLRDNILSPGINFMPQFKTFTLIGIPPDLITQSVQTSFVVQGYTSLPATETEEETCLVQVLYQDVPIVLPQINVTGSIVEARPVSISIYSNRR